MVDPRCTVQTGPKVQVELAVQNGGEGRRVILLMLQRKRSQSRIFGAQSMQSRGGCNARSDFEMHVSFACRKSLYGLRFNPLKRSVQTKQPRGVVRSSLKSVWPTFGLRFHFAHAASAAIAQWHEAEVLTNPEPSRAKRAKQILVSRKGQHVDVHCLDVNRNASKRL